MADSTIDGERIYLNDNWPGPIHYLDAAPSDLTTTPTAAGHNLGEKIALWNSGAGIEGYSIFLYVQFINNAAVAIAAKSALVPDAVGTGMYVVTNDPDDCIKIPTNYGGFALGAATDEDYGWMWVGGVVPEAFVSGLGGDYATDSNVAAGAFIFHNLDADAIGISVADTAGEMAAGFALAADAA